MTVKIGGKTYKGKYKGPDKFKGDEKKLAVYYAAKRKAASAPKTTAKPATTASKPTTTATPLKQVTAPTGSVSSNSSGNIQLQTNADIENQALEASQTLKDEEEKATQLQQQGLIAEMANKYKARNSFDTQRSRSNQIMASRGMRGSAALQQNALDKRDYGTALQDIAAARAASDKEAENIKTTAKNWWDTRQGQLNLSRQQYTNERSKSSPTSGSTPVNSGVKATTPYKKS